MGGEGRAGEEPDDGQSAFLFFSSVRANERFGERMG